MSIPNDIIFTGTSLASITFNASIEIRGRKLNTGANLIDIGYVLVFIKRDIPY